MSSNRLSGWTGTPTPHKGVVTYSLSPNRQRPLANAMHNAVFNTWRRTRKQILYVLPPFVAAYAIMNWAIERYACPINSDTRI
jgi:ubiquinol-cytochrome c reductase subunit 8